MSVPVGSLNSDQEAISPFNDTESVWLVVGSKREPLADVAYWTLPPGPVVRG